MPGKDHRLHYVPEPSSVSRAFVGWAALSALLLLFIGIGGLYGIYRSVAPTKGPPSPQTFAQPRVDTHESEELRRLLDAQNKRLKTWGWSDPQHTLVQIPIERAIQLLSKKGAAAYAPLLPEQQAPSSPPAAAARTNTQGENATTPHNNPSSSEIQR
jgi:hypothetical protein